MANTHLQYDRSTINLVFELKRSLPLDKQADFKLSNPDLVPKVKEIYLSDSSKKSKALAKRVLEKAGIPVKKANKSLLDMFRANHPDAKSAPHKGKKIKMYRGQAVE